MAKSIRVGVQEGGGSPPNYRWSVWILDRAFTESQAAFSPAQYSHLAMQMQELARDTDPSHSSLLSIRKIEDYYELRDKGGVLGKINARVFFGIDKQARALVVLGAIKKQNDGATPRVDKIRMRARWRAYLNGEYEQPD